MFDTIVIGSGPAGVSAAIYLKRAGFNVIVLTTNVSALLKAHIIENYYGFNNLSGENLYNIGIEQLKKLSIPLFEEEAVNIEWNGNFTVETNINTYSSKTVVIATGIGRPSVKIENLKEFEGKGVSYCATCDGFFYRNKNVAVIGNGNLAYHEASYLKNIVSNVTVFTNGEDPNDIFIKNNIPVISDKIVRVNGDNTVTEIETIIDKYSIDGIFIATGTASGASFAKRLGIALKNNNIEVNENYETNIKGLYAIGDVLGKELQVNKAVNDGYLVSKSIKKFLKE